MTSRPDRTELTAKELEGQHFLTAYDAVESMRGNWLHDRGPMSLDRNTQVVVLVYFDDVKLGTVETLRSIPVQSVSVLRHLDGVEAQARYGIGHGAGVIQVESWSRGKETGPIDISAGTVTENAVVSAADGFALASGGRAASIVVSSHDFAGVIRAVRDLSADVERVAGVAPAVAMDSSAGARSVVIVGTIGKSPLIDHLVQGGKLNTAGVAGKWESYVRQVVANPMPGVDQALVIAGSDKRGTIYGIYDVSSLIGVSPWYWWADVPAPKQPELLIAPARVTLGEPAVKYRGIFINDEAPAFSGWTREKFGGVNHGVYEKMFELILRMKGNYLWPAMWGNAFADDDSLNAKLADEYGVVMGTSHHEPMTRAQQEWKRYGKGEWNYEKNDSTLRDFWREGIERMVNGGQPRENIVTLGMRGDGDMPMTQGSNIALLERIVADQRKILSDVTGKDASRTPTLWALYKEVQDYYDKGMRAPEDVTLLFADDNWGNIRRLPAAADRNHSGGFGVYYHFDYVGGPRNYKWINTNPIARVWEQMHLAHEYGANRIWIVNVGDLKPMEFPIQFFLDDAWDPSKIPAERLPEYTRQWAAQQFGAANAPEIADITTTYLKYAGRRKPELLQPETYSLANYREAERVAEDYAALVRRAEALAARMPASHKDAYYELVLHPVLAAANLNDLYITTAKNRLYAQQQRASTNDLAERARQLFERDAEISRTYNTELAGGKWSHMMDQTHIGYTIWQEPPRNVMPRVDLIQVPARPELGVSYEGQSRSREPAFPEFDAYARQSYYLDIYNKGSATLDYSVESGEPWLTVSAPKGRVEKDVRVWVSVDWAKAPAGTTKLPVTVTGSDGGRFTVQANVRNPASPRRDDVAGFVESNGYVSMEAEHFTRSVALAPARWQRIPDLGRTASAMTLMPVTSPAQAPGGASPRLEYKLFVFDSGAVSVKTYLSPMLNFSGSATGMRYAVSIDDEAPQVVNAAADTSGAAWNTMVADNIVVMTTKHVLATPGAHTLKFWAVDPGIVVQKFVMDLGGLKPSYLGPPESFRGRR
ncbi:MAG: glycosyl hydrolase 115 family protein [Gemmatimonadaceae bacterium]